jgi:cytochrome c oxidase subunit 3
VERLHLAAQRQAAGDDPWEGNTLEWATVSPPPPYNFDRLPEIRSERPAVRRPHGRIGTERTTTMTADSHALHHRAQPDRRPPARRRGGIGNPVLGMLLFLTSEVMFFAGLFAAYFSVPRQRAGRGLAADQPRHERAVLPPVPAFVLPATILLILSSFTGQFAVWAIRRGDRTGFLRNLSVTCPGDRLRRHAGFDYALLYSEGITLDSGTFGTTYYTLTGFHMAHVIGGVIMLSVVLYRGLGGQFSARHHDAVEASSLYWHFVDVVWIVLFSVLYLLPGSGH